MIQDIWLNNSILTEVASVAKVPQSASKTLSHLCLNDLVVEPPHEAGLRVGLRSAQDLLGNLVLHNFHHLDSDVMKIFVFVDILGIIVFSLMKLIFNYLEWTESRGKYEMWLLVNVMILIVWLYHYEPKMSLSAQWSIFLLNQMTFIDWRSALYNSCISSSNFV